MNLLNLLFTNRCISCNKIISVNKTFCEKCEGDIIRTEKPACGKCAQNIYKCVCRTSIKKSYNKIGSPFIYKGSIASAIKLLKFKKVTTPVKYLADEMYKEYTLCYGKTPIDCIIPVPLHKKKLKTRGFNQSYLLSKELSKLTKIPLAKNKLIKIKETKDQHLLSPSERLTNLKDAFSVRGSLKGKNILLIDDIMTTGSTLNECTRTLKKSGAARIYVLIAALV